MAELSASLVIRRGLERRRNHGLEASFMNALEAILHSYIFLDYATMDSFAMNDGLRWLAENGLKGEEDGSDNFCSCVCSTNHLSCVSQPPAIFVVYWITITWWPQAIVPMPCTFYSIHHQLQKKPPSQSHLFFLSFHEMMCKLFILPKWNESTSATICFQKGENFIQHIFSGFYEDMVACLVPVLPLKADANFTHKKQLFIVQHAIYWKMSQQLRDIRSGWIWFGKWKW